MGPHGFNRNDMEVQRIIKEIAYTVSVLILISVIAIMTPNTAHTPEVYQPSCGCPECGTVFYTERQLANIKFRDEYHTYVLKRWHELSANS